MNYEASDLLTLSKQELVDLILSLSAQVTHLASELRELQGRLSQTSKNSSKPPSSDGYEKPNPKSQSEKSGKSSGGQKGHAGSRLEQVSTPDEIENHDIENCINCGASLSLSVAEVHSCRQEIDVLKPQVKVVEHRSLSRLCTACGYLNKGVFPAHVTQSAQYGSQLKTLATYFSNYQFIPLKRLQELLVDCYDLNVSQGTLVNMNQSCYELLAGSETAIKAQLQQSAYVHFDESGMRMQSKLHWLHGAGNERLTHYHLDKKRGSEGIDAAGILSDFKGKAIHDHWYPYFRYTDCEHGLCNAHHLRELTYVEETYQQHWAGQLRAWLLKAKSAVDNAKLAGKLAFSKSTIRRYENSYQALLKKAKTQLPSLECNTKPLRGRKKQHKAKNLWDRLTNYQKEILGFIHDFNTPFTNNLAERDIRMCKVKQKISGCFRSQKGAKQFCRIRGYISTAKKNNINIMDALNDAYQLKPFIPKPVEI